MIETVTKILEEVMAMSDMKEPEYEVEPEETALGELTPVQKKAYNLLRMMQNQRNQYLRDIDRAQELEVKYVLSCKYNLLNMKGQLLFNWFWINVREEFEVDGNIGVRKGYQLVTFPDSHTPKSERERGLPSGNIGV